MSGIRPFWNEILKVWDSTLGKPVELKSTNGAAHVVDGATATIIVTSGGNTYIAEAAPGSSQTASVWRCHKVDSSGSVTWADGDSNFDNNPGSAGANLSGLSYS